MAGIDVALDALKQEVVALLADERMQDPDLMLSHNEATLLLTAEASPHFSDEEKALIRSALLVRCYDLKRRSGRRDAQHADIVLIEDWMQRTFPDGQIPADYPYGYIAESLQGANAKAPEILKPASLLTRLRGALMRKSR